MSNETGGRKMHDSAPPSAAKAPRCGSCRWWTEGDREWDEIVHPTDPDTYQSMDTEFSVRLCRHPKLLFCERPLERDGFAVADGSNYMANLYTAEDFGCVRHESAEADRG